MNDLCVNKNIVTAEFKLDDKILKGHYSYDSPGVYYKLFSTDKKLHSKINNLDELNPKNVKEKNVVCFSNVKNEFCKKRHNYIFYKVTKVPNIIKNDKILWLSVLKRSKIFPSYCNTKMLKTGTIILDMTKIPVSTLYAQLSLIRYLREAPKIVKGVLYLIKAGLSPFSAISFCGSTMISSGGHTFIPLHYSYGQDRKSCNEVRINAGIVWAVRELLINGATHQNLYFGKLKDWQGWEALRAVGKIANKVPILMVTLTELFRKDLSAVLECPDKKRVTKFFNEYEKWRKNDKE